MSSNFPVRAEKLRQRRVILRSNARKGGLARMRLLSGHQRKKFAQMGGLARARRLRAARRTEIARIGGMARVAKIKDGQWQP